MDTRNEEIKQRLSRLVDEINVISDLLDSTNPILPHEAVERLANHICLECKKPIPKKDWKRNIKCGCHEKCYRKNIRDVARGVVTRHELAEAGRMAPPKSGGRPRIGARALHGRAEHDSPAGEAS